MVGSDLNLMMRFAAAVDVRVLVVYRVRAELRWLLAVQLLLTSPALIF
jgi:hypothetical protein